MVVWSLQSKSKMQDNGSSDDLSRPMHKVSSWGQLQAVNVADPSLSLSLTIFFPPTPPPLCPCSHFFLLIPCLSPSVYFSLSLSFSFLSCFLPPLHFVYPLLTSPLSWPLFMLSLSCPLSPLLTLVAFSPHLLFPDSFHPLIPHRSILLPPCS